MRISPTSSRNSLGFTLTETLLALAVCALAGFGALHAALVATRMEGQSAHAAADLDQFDRDWAARRGGWAGEGTDG
ncbi:MAG: hypothetical protein KBA51_09445, partial [Kiritimatiellae bacterium]|nr:hypothetical protein [Kiritimatiellia bacterium]